MAVLTLKSAEIAEFPDVIRDFASHKAVIENCSEKTVCEYLYDLRTFFRFLIAENQGIRIDSEDFKKIDIRSVDIDYLATIREGDIYAFLNYVAGKRENGWSARSRKISALRAFFKFVVTVKKWLKKNPMADIESPKKQSSLPKFLTLEESVQLLNTVRNDSNSRHNLRDFTIITLFLNCGMRLSELVAIDVSDVRPDMSALVVTGKGRKERTIFLNQACVDAITEYLDYRKVHDPKGVDTPALFLSGQTERISPKTVQYAVNKYLNLAGLGGRGLSVHKLRHTAATLMYQNGVDVRVLKDVLGHEQLNTTQIYTHVSNRGMEEAMKKNPLASFQPIEKDSK